MKKYLPINLDITNKKCVVGGAGPVGNRKADRLREFGGDVTIIDKEYKTELLRDAYLVVAATDNREINNQIAEDARKRGILVNVVDVKEGSDFITPAVIEKDGVMITVSTHGRDPKRSKVIKNELACYRFKS